MIRFVARWLDRSTVLYLRLLRLVNGPREHIQCRPPSVSFDLGGSPSVPLNTELRKEILALSPPEMWLGTAESASPRPLVPFSFPSQAPSGIPTNDRVTGYAWLAGQPGERPAVVLLHGWMMSHFRGLYPHAQVFWDNGFDVFFLELPYHMHRKPPGAFSGECYYGSSGQFTADSVHQSLIDALSLILWLKRLDTPAVGAWGVSLGGWIVLLLACYCHQMDFAVATVPACCLEELSKESLLSKKLMPKWRAANPVEAAQQLRTYDPIHLKPVLAPSRILLAVANFDEFVPARFPLRLAERWHGVRVLRYPHGHISVNMAKAPLRDLAAFLEALRLDGKRGNGFFRAH